MSSIAKSKSKRKPTLKNLATASILESHVTPKQLTAAGYPPKIVNNYKPLHQKLMKYERLLKETYHKLYKLENRLKPVLTQSTVNWILSKPLTSNEIVWYLNLGNNHHRNFYNIPVSKNWKNEQEYKKLRNNFKTHHFGMLSTKSRMNQFETEYKQWLRGMWKDVDKLFHRYSRLKSERSKLLAKGF